MSKQNGPMGGLLCSKHLCIPVMHHRMRNSWVIRKPEHLGESAPSHADSKVFASSQTDSPGSASILFFFFDGGEKIISTTTGRGGKKEGRWCKCREGSQCLPPDSRKERIQYKLLFATQQCESKATFVSLLLSFALNALRRKNTFLNIQCNNGLFDLLDTTVSCSGKSFSIFNNQSWP